MSEKYVIFGATGSIGSSLAEQLKNSGNDIHLVNLVLSLKNLDAHIPL